MADMRDMTGWTEVRCEEADEARAQHPVSPGSSLTDLDGEYGQAVIYTEWHRQDDGTPVLRDYLWNPHSPDRGVCAHYIPTEGTIR